MTTLNYAFCYRNWAKTEQIPKIGEIFWEIGKDEVLDDSEAEILTLAICLANMAQTEHRAPYMKR